MKNNYPKHPDGRVKLYQENKKEWNSWRAMLNRCNNPKYRYYYRYGGRGIKCCKRWKLFKNFLDDMGKRPDGTTLDRIDNDGDYCPENCKWSTYFEQIRNSTTCKKDKDGFSLKKKQENCIIQSKMLAKASCSSTTFYRRLKEGWTIEEAYNTPPLNKLRYEENQKKCRFCPVCGNRCKHPRDKYCCKEHFWLTRRKDGKFSKEVQDENLS